VKHRNLIDTETQLSSTRASVSALNSVSAELAAKIKQATTDKQTLYAKYQKIQDFNKLTVVLVVYTVIYNANKTLAVRQNVTQIERNW